MSDSYKSVLKAIITALKADATISGIVGSRVYTNVPQNATFPYMVVAIQSLPFDTKTDNGMSHTIDISGYSRKNSPAQAADLRSAAYDIMHKGESNLTLDSGNLSSMLYSGIGNVLKEPDGVTWKSLLRFNAIVD